MGLERFFKRRKARKIQKEVDRELAAITADLYAAKTKLAHLMLERLRNPNLSTDVGRFNEKFGVKERSAPGFPSEAEVQLRVELVAEEIEELSQAITNGDIVETADAIVDSIYVLIGMARVFGIDIRPIWQEVHRSNMKKDGGPTRQDGKILKPEGWEPPRIAEALAEQGADAMQGRP